MPMKRKAVASKPGAGKVIKVGFLVGKDNDPVKVRTQPRDFPAKYRQTGGGDRWGGSFHVDAVTAWNIGKKYPELKVDLISGEETSLERLKKNDINFVIGTDYLNAIFKDMVKKGDSAHAKMVRKALSSPQGKCFPDWHMQDWVYMKDKYMGECEKAKIPMLPTIYLRKFPDPVKLLKDIQKRGWKRFVVKPYPSCWSIGFLAAYTKECEQNPALLRDHFNTDPCDAYLVQEFLESPEFPGQSFSEIRSWWIDGHYSHSAVTTAEDEHQGIDGITLPPPKEDLAEVVKLGKKVMAVVMQNCKFQGKKTAPPLMRIDIGLVGKGFKVTGSGWNPNKRNYFLNEIENMGTNWLTRYAGNDYEGLRNRGFKNMQAVDMCERMTETLAKKAHELCGGSPWQPSWTPNKWHGQEAVADGVPTMPQIKDSKLVSETSQAKKRKLVPEKSQAKKRKVA